MWPLLWPGEIGENEGLDGIERCFERGHCLAVTEHWHNGTTQISMRTMHGDMHGANSNKPINCSFTMSTLTLALAPTSVDYVLHTLMRI